MDKTILLIIEDEQSLSNVLRAKFIAEGFEVLTAANGKDGLDVAFKKHPDLILLDLLMPVMDGVTMLKKFREDDWGKTVPVIVLSNLDDTEHMAKVAEKGIFDYLVKTERTMDEVVEKVKEKIIH